MPEDANIIDRVRTLAERMGLGRDVDLRGQRHPSPHGHHLRPLDFNQFRKQSRVPSGRQPYLVGKLSGPSDITGPYHRVLAEEPNQQPAEPEMPEWLTRCSEPRRRMMLFFSGGALILISFICFGPAKHTPKKQK